MHSFTVLEARNVKLVLARPRLQGQESPIPLPALMGLFHHSPSVCLLAHMAFFPRSQFSLQSLQIMTPTLGPVLIQDNLIYTLAIYSCKDPISKGGHILRFQVGMNLGEIPQYARKLNNNVFRWTDKMMFFYFMIYTDHAIQGSSGLLVKQVIVSINTNFILYITQ